MPPLTDQAELRVFSVPVSSVWRLKDEVARLGRVAKRLGLGERPTLQVHEGTTRELLQKQDTVYLAEGSVEGSASDLAVIEVVDCAIRIPPGGIQAAGQWRVVASMKPTATPRGRQNEVFATGHADQEKAEAFRDKPGCCDHCQLTRNRNSTLVLQEVATGALKQVGGECSQLYIGDTVENAIRGLRFQKEVLRFVETCEDVSNERVSRENCLQAWSSQEVVAHAFACVRELGWKPAQSKGTFRPDPDATWRSVEAVLMKHPSIDPLAPPYRVTAQDREAASKALAWLNDAAPAAADGNFLSQLKRFFEPGWVSEKRLGFAVAIVPTWQRIVLAAQREQLATGNGHLGAIGERKEAQVRLLGARDFESFSYGAGTAYEFVTPEGQLCSWVTKRRALGDVSPGDSLRIQATIKGHGLHEGHQKTELNRVKLLAKLSQVIQEDRVEAGQMAGCKL